MDRRDKEGSLTYAASLPHSLGDLGQQVRPPSAVPLCRLMAVRACGES
jgi:hypothetical protein